MRIKAAASSRLQKSPPSQSQAALDRNALVNHRQRHQRSHQRDECRGLDIGQQPHDRPHCKAVEALASDCISDLVENGLVR